LELVKTNIDIGYIGVYNFFKKLTENIIRAMVKKEEKVIKSF
jgi:DNA-binding transcriptional regulator of glucitol operon